MAETWYVSEGGDNAAAGTEAAPLRTLHAAMDRAMASEGADVILLRRGEAYPAGTWYPDAGRLGGLRIGAWGEGDRPRVVGWRGITIGGGAPIRDITIEDLVVVGERRVADDPASEFGGVSINAPGGDGERITIRNVGVIGGNIGFRFQGVSGITIERCVVLGTLVQGAFFSGCGDVRIAESAFVGCGWREGVDARDNFRDHGIYANETTEGVVLERVIVAHSNFYGWKAELGGEVRDSLFVGNVIQVGAWPNGGLADDWPYDRAAHPLVSERNVYAAPTDSAIRRAWTVESLERGIGAVVMRDDVVGPAVTADGRAMETPWRAGAALSFETPGTVVLGYGEGVETATAMPEWAALDVWRGKAERWLRDGIDGGVVDGEVLAAREAVLKGVEPITPPSESDGEPVEVPDEPVSEGSSTDPPVDEGGVGGVAAFLAMSNELEPVQRGGAYYVLEVDGVDAAAWGVGGPPKWSSSFRAVAGLRRAVAVFGKDRARLRYALTIEME